MKQTSILHELIITEDNFDFNTTLLAQDFKIVFLNFWFYLYFVIEF